MKGRKKIIFIISAGHSGSTFLTKLLGQKTELFAGSELVDYTNESVRSNSSYCSCGVTYRECKYWSKVAAQINIDNLQLFSLLKKDKKKLDYIKLFSTIFFNKKYDSNTITKNICDYQNLYDSIFYNGKSDVIIDSSKNFFNALILASQRKYSYGFIFLKRDGRAVLSSYMKSFYSIDLDGKKVKNERKIYNPHDVISYWVKQNILGLLLKVIRYNKTVTLKHENLIKNTFEELNKLSLILDFSFDKTMANFTDEDHMFGGNSSRLNTKSIKKNDLFSWRDRLSRKELKLFNIKAKLINFILGYH